VQHQTRNNQYMLTVNVGLHCTNNQQDGICDSSTRPPQSCYKSIFTVTVVARQNKLSLSAYSWNNALYASNSYSDRMSTALFL